MLDARWWQRGIVYQIYPRSFMDSNGDGIGDLRGIRSRLSYLAWLGVDAIWISPIYTSPMADFGYDVSDYRGIDPRFGTLDDFDALVRDAHGLGLKVILDFVPNHTSDQHPWFVESRASRESAKRGWYLWRDPAPDGGPPTNWLSEFGGPAWESDAATGQYYYHAYLKEQPDLDWRNPEVRDAMLSVMRFWLDRGVDGFRVDTIHHLIKDSELRDNPPNPHWRPGMPPHRKLLRLYTTDRPEVHEAVAAMRRVLDDYDDRVLIGEAYLPFDRLMAYYGQDLSGMHLPFNFHLIGAPWDARAIAEIVREYEAALPEGAWPNWVLGNHDKPRIKSRVGAAQARVAAMLLLTLRGTPTLYYGDEIGMCDVPIAPGEVQDPFEKNVPGLGVGRDPERTPMQWGGGAGCGFTAGRPWLPLAPDADRNNVEALRGDPGSILSLYRALIALRRAEPALAVGAYAPLAAGEDVLAYAREHGGRRLLVLLNLSSHPRRLALAAGAGGARVLLSTGLDRAGERLDEAAELRPDEGLIAEAQGAPG
ncbi:alpha-amylase family glycosyl hydrolase [Sorangium sp. So ce385]|uniref:alpha-amylase family glycosyl hydrolase n=1 Tax=Sorangium sp. So ce385 TaxID=3133308 RepID=UPI003F5C8018